MRELKGQIIPPELTTLEEEIRMTKEVASAGRGHRGVVVFWAGAIVFWFVALTLAALLRAEAQIF